MDRDKQVGFVSIGQLGTFFQCQVDICLARVNYFHVGTVSLHHLPKGQRHAQREVFFIRSSPWRTCIVPTVSGVNHQYKFLVCRTYRYDSQDQKQYAENSFHQFSLIIHHNLHASAFAVGSHRRVQFYDLNLNLTNAWKSFEQPAAYSPGHMLDEI